MSGDFYFNTSTYPFLSDGDLAGELDVPQSLTAFRAQSIGDKDEQQQQVITKEDSTLSFHVEIADWGEIRTTLLNMSVICRHSDGEMQNATPRHEIIEDHIEHLERNTASMVPPVKSTTAEELDAPSSPDLFLTAQPAPPSLPSTLARTPRSGILHNFRRRYSRCLPLIQGDLPYSVPTPTTSRQSVFDYQQVPISGSAAAPSALSRRVGTTPISIPSTASAPAPTGQNSSVVDAGEVRRPGGGRRTGLGRDWGYVRVRNPNIITKDSPPLLEIIFRSSRRFSSDDDNNDSRWSHDSTLLTHGATLPYLLVSLPRYGDTRLL
ncbi:hypothetical protein BU17DRAFT_97077 [Hysterangium stoloniferum]|nr:hypothetical protein BU17DRAFT_97077 [Hysterangium stoloniferum]